MRSTGFFAPNIIDLFGKAEETEEPKEIEEIDKTEKTEKVEKTEKIEKTKETEEKDKWQENLDKASNYLRSEANKSLKKLATISLISIGVILIIWLMCQIIPCF